MNVGDIVFFKGTKSRGDSWGTFMLHFKGNKTEDLYGIIYAIRGKEIWIHIHKKSTEELLHRSTWGFLEQDLELKQIGVKIES